MSCGHDAGKMGYVSGIPVRRTVGGEAVTQTGTFMCRTITTASKLLICHLAKISHDSCGIFINRFDRARKLPYKLSLRELQTGVLQDKRFDRGTE